MTMTFRDRVDAGRRLAERLAAHSGESAVVVALPRGGVPVAAEVAKALGAPLDVLVVRKLGCPWQPELGMGAIAEGDITVRNEDLIERIGVDDATIRAVADRERAELDRRVRRYRGDRPPVPVEGCTAILVDDGRDRSTARAAVDVLTWLPRAAGGSVALRGDSDPRPRRGRGRPSRPRACSRRSAVHDDSPRPPTTRADPLAERSEGSADVS
jgi:predicted phosphoribosyltransferase